MVPQSGKYHFSRPQLLLAYADSSHAALTSRQFRRQGWEVHLVHCGVEARRMAHILRPQLVLLDADLPGESGWLTCAKLVQELKLRSYIVGDEQRADSAAFSAFVGAAGFIRRDQSNYLLLDEEDCRENSVAV